MWPGSQGQYYRAAKQASCSTHEVSRLLPLAGACGAIIIVSAALLVMELLHRSEHIRNAK